MKKLKTAIILVASAILLIGASIYGTCIYLRNKYYNLVYYEEKLLDIKLEDYVENVDGYIILDYAEYAVVKMRVIKGCEEAVTKNLTKNLACVLFPSPLL